MEDILVEVARKKGAQCSMKRELLWAVPLYAGTLLWVFPKPNPGATDSLGIPQLPAMLQGHGTLKVASHLVREEVSSEAMNYCSGLRKKI